MAKIQGKVSFYLKETKANKQTPVRATFCYNNSQFKYYEPKLSIHPKHWNNKEQKAREVRDFPYATFNTRLKNIANTIIEVYEGFKNENNNLEPALVELRERVNKARNKVGRSEERTKLDFFSFLEFYLKDIHKKTNLATGKQISTITIRAYRQTFRVLRDYTKETRKALNFEHINTDFYNDFTYYLTHAKGFKINTVGKHLRNIKTFMQEALDRNLTTNINFKKRAFRVVSEKTDAIYLNELELKAIENLDLSTNKRLEKVRDLFLVGCWTGLRFSDFTQIKPHNITNEFFEIDTQKTGAKVIIPIHRTVKAIIEKYKTLYANFLPPSISNQKMNDYLKEIGGQVKILHEPVTVSNIIKGKKVYQTFLKYEMIVTHTARRSFATNQYLKGIPSHDIMKITGHKTEKAFLRYLKLENKDAAIRLMDFWRNEERIKAV